MIGIVLVTHGHLADEFLLAMQHVVGVQPQIATVCVGADDDTEIKREEVFSKVKEVNTGDGVILLTDIFGGTPSNLATSMFERANVEVIAGINLPMLIKLTSLRNEKDLKEIASKIKEAGAKYITIASEILKENK